MASSLNGTDFSCYHIYAWVQDIANSIINQSCFIEMLEKRPCASVKSASGVCHCQALNPRIAYLDHLHDTILLNEQQIEMLESGRMTVGSGAELGRPRDAAVEVHRLHQTNGELRVLIAQDVAWDRRQEAIFAMSRQFYPHGNGQPTMESISDFDAADAEWQATQREANRIVMEIRSGLRR